MGQLICRYMQLRQEEHQQQQQHVCCFLYNNVTHTRHSTTENTECSRAVAVASSTGANSGRLSCRELPAAKRSQQQLVQGVSGGGGDVQFYSNIDRLLDGGDSDARKARELLLEQRTLVSFCFILACIHFYVLFGVSY
jgi:hypothetical protein